MTGIFLATIIYVIYVSFVWKTGLIGTSTSVSIGMMWISYRVTDNGTPIVQPSVCLNSL